MIRAAAKNHGFAAVVDEPRVLRRGARGADEHRRDALAARPASRSPPRRSPTPPATTPRSPAGSPSAATTSRTSSPAPTRRRWTCPYGENPHQRAAFYTQVGARRGVLTRVRQLHGKQLSFNNILDLDGARSVLAELRRRAPACVIVKHNNPCGAALGDDGLDAYRKAFAGDPVSAFGGIIALNTHGRPRASRRRSSQQFIEVLIAPGYDEDALALLTEKPNVRILEDEERRRERNPDFDIRQVDGGLLVQDRDVVVADRAQLEVVTERQPTDAEWRDLLFAWRVCRHVKSNAIVVAEGEATLGIGAGQMSRVDSVKIAMSRDWIQGRDGLVARLRRVLPVRRRPQRGARRRRQGAHPARRLDPRRRGHRRRRRARRGDGVHPPPPLPPLVVRGSRGA